MGYASPVSGRSRLDLSSDFNNAGRGRDAYDLAKLAGTLVKGAA